MRVDLGRDFQARSKRASFRRMSRPMPAPLRLWVAVIAGLSLAGPACDASGSTEPSGATVAAPSSAQASEEAPAADPLPEKPGDRNEPEELPPSEASETGESSGGDVQAQAEGEVASAEDEASVEKIAPEEKLRVLVIGDSLAATGFGAMMEKGLDAHPQVSCYRKGKSSSGLARPDFYNWMDEARRQIDYRKPDLVVVIIGGNDGQDLTTKSGKGKRVHWKTHEWKIAYRQRMDAFLSEIGGEDRKVVWLGLPQAGMRSFEKKLVTIREVQKAAVDALGERAAYVDTTPFLVDEKGKLNEFGKVRGKKRTIRADDRIHFTMAGSQFLANHVVPEILNQIGLSPVED